MLWPIALPAEITFWIAVTLVGILTVCAPALKWKHGKTFKVTSLLACLLFVPSCIGIMEIVDRLRFGTFQYASFSGVNDFRVERYLPTTAMNITLRKYPSGHQAKYSISETDLKHHVDELWKKHDEHSAISRDDVHDRASETASGVDNIPTPFPEFEQRFEGSGWETPLHIIEMHSPIERDGGGATYFYDRATQTAYHRGSYW